VTDLVDDLVRLHVAKPEFKPQYLMGIAMTNLGAGNDTLESTLTSVLVYVSRDPVSLRRVHDEIDAYVQKRSSDESEFVSTEEVTNNLPFLMACIRESLRLAPVIGMNLSRTTPAPSASRSGPLMLSGYHIPPGSIVGCNPWGLHRNPDIFGQDANEFRPTRWLESSKDSNGMRSDTDRISLSWGGPSRSCPGRHLGELILYKTVAELLRRFDIEVTLKHAIEEGPKYFVSPITGATARFIPRKARF
jgi:cytochrome P450